MVVVTPFVATTTVWERAVVARERTAIAKALCVAFMLTMSWYLVNISRSKDEKKRHFEVM